MSGIAIPIALTASAVVFLIYLALLVYPLLRDPTVVSPYSTQQAVGRPTTAGFLTAWFTPTRAPPRRPRLRTRADVEASPSGSSSNTHSNTHSQTHSNTHSSNNTHSNTHSHSTHLRLPPDSKPPMSQRRSPHLRDLPPHALPSLTHPLPHSLTHSPSYTSSTQHLSPPAPAYVSHPSSPAPEYGTFIGADGSIVSVAPSNVNMGYRSVPLGSPRGEWLAEEYLEEWDFLEEEEVDMDP
ncbi:hypothetical protein DFP72DRAFT_1081344 [Ephemerocybe angulata]|uniref:Uncharacterized protein n=1 Tax=Ephemerocybe angulata TaxID=980116 RepID=A0A8H6LVK6_9AGAR|nr:hypothetical protein DFP72DRAFT_1081344 [Tulosesus angulatus]